MKIGVPKEVVQGEKRVAVTPSSLSMLLRRKHEFFIQSGAGEAASFKDSDYEKVGAKILANAAEIFSTADVILKVQPPTEQEVQILAPGSILVGLLKPFENPDIIRRIAENKVTSFAMEYIPRITRAQNMDALSSMATLAGYKAVIMAANRLSKIMPLMMTAAGSTAPATVLVLGAGVAGLQAIATAKRLGAKVEAFDPRPVVKEQVESVGAIFVEMEVLEDIQTADGYAKEQSEEFLKREQNTIAERLPKVDVVITTAQIFGKPAPLLITAQMVGMMPSGSVIVDLAAEQGGNCALTRPDEMVEEKGVTIFGPTNLPATLPVHASQMFAKNITTLVDHIFEGGRNTFNFEDEITKSACLTYDGEIRIEAVRRRVEETGL